ncbi:MAG TPA: GTPase [Candidatus Limnocylindrales bacterium]|nr:GTPase [Candidatus Limnocylindrales bacterium]
MIEGCLAAFDRAIDEAGALGIDTTAAAAVRRGAEERLGFPSSAYVVALVGGTGVGKSSLLNALAGRSVSRASALRPTTAHPVAWIPAEREGELRGLLDWLGVRREDVLPADGAGLANVAILDLPDLDSTEQEHRRRVEAVLPRVDAVIWVTDPEKYADAVLHDEFLATWLPRLDRQVVVINKADRLSRTEVEAVRRDLVRDLGRARGGRVAPTVMATSAVAGAGAAAGDAGGSAGNGSGIGELREWLAEQVESKSVVRARLLASIRDSAVGLAAAAGIEPAAARSPAGHLADDARRQAIDDATAAVLRIVDLQRLEAQAVGATRARARARGAGPLGGLTALIYRWSGREAKVADPVAFLARWRDRGSLDPAVEPIRAASATVLRTAPDSIRRQLASDVAPDAIASDLGRAVDRAVAARGRDVPTSRVWPLLGLLQTLATLALVVTAIWVVLWVLVKFPVDSVAVPIAGRVPAPLVVLVAVLAIGYLLARLLGLHAGWIGRRWAGHLAAGVRDNVRRDVAASAFAPIDRLDERRVALAGAIATLQSSCRDG